MGGSRAPNVVTVVPTFNEEKWIGRCLDSLLAQTLPADRHVIHIVDGGSSDDTLMIVKERMREDGPRIVIIENPHRRVPQARNLSLSSMGEEVDLVFEMNAHAWVPEDHLEKRIADLLSIEDELGEEVAGVGCRVVPADDDDVGLLGDWIESTLSSSLGSGGGQFARFSGRHQHRVPAFVLHRRQALADVGGWDEGLPTNQDSDLSMRILASGKQLWRSDASHLHMVKRRSLRDFIRMCRRYGFWRMQTLKRHPGRINPLEFLPLIGLLITGVLLVYEPRTALVPIMAYLAAILFTGLYEALTGRSPSRIVGVPPLLLILHTMFSIGLIQGLFMRSITIEDRRGT